QRIHHEAIIHSQLQHPNILPFLGIYHEETGSLPLMILPFLEHGSLEKLLDDLRPSGLMDQSALIKIVVGSARGLVYLHSRDPPIIHGDLHPGNILIDKSGIPILCDFGLGRIHHNISRIHTKHEAGGKLWFVAPEVWESTRSTKKSDVFSLAMTYLNAWTAQPPFFELDQGWRVASALSEGLRPMLPTKSVALDPAGKGDFWELLKHMWTQEPSNRPTSDYVLMHLEQIFNLCRSYVTLQLTGLFHN
ncbi:kinase-like protein, partial [Clavulina sp. PMI_390]